MKHASSTLLALGLVSCASNGGPASGKPTTAATSVVFGQPPGGSAGAEPGAFNDNRPLRPPPRRCSTEPRAEWTAPRGLDAELERAARVLFDLGLFEPNAEFVAVRASVPALFGPERSAEVRGWLLPDRTLLSVRGDLLVPTDAPRRIEVALDTQRVERWADAREARERGSVRSNLLTAALLARAGRADLANAQWRRAATYFSTGRERSALLDLGETYFDSGIAAYRAGRFELARRHFERLDCARAYIEENVNSLVAFTTIEGMRPRMRQERSTEYLRDVPSLLEEARRRASSSRTASPLDAATPSSVRATTDPAQLASLPIEQLIAALDDVLLEVRSDEPHPLDRDPIVRAIRARGPAATPALLSAFERDGRLTRTVVTNTFPFVREVFFVRTLLAYLITQTSGMDPREFGWTTFSDDPTRLRPSEVARALRVRWDRIGSISPYERALSSVSDASSNFERQVFSVSWLFAARDPNAPSWDLYIERPAPSIYDPLASTEANSPQRPRLTPTQRSALFDALRARMPALGPISDRAQPAFDREMQRCAYLPLLYLLDARATEPMLRETLNRFYTRAPDNVTAACSAWVSAALVALGDQSVATEFTTRVRERELRSGDLNSVGTAWAPLANRPEGAAVFEQLARRAFVVNAHQIRIDERGTTATVHSVNVLSMVDERTLRPRAVRESILTLLEDTRAAAIIRFERGSFEVLYLNARGARTFRYATPPDGADFIEPDRDWTVRIMDSVADQLANRVGIRGAPLFDIRWTQARRDRAIAELRAMLQAMR